MRFPMFFAATAALVLGGCGQLTDAQFEAKLKQVLAKNPQIVIDAVEAFQKQQGDAEEAKAKVAADKLWNDMLKPQLAKQVLDPTVGPANAKVTIVQYTDYNCPYCQVANDWVWKQADDPRKDVRIVFKEMPIPSIPGHESSPAASRAAIAADKQGKYREMHQALMKAQGVGEDTIERAARVAGVDYAKLRADMKSPEIDARMAQIEAESEVGQVRGTPTFFINGESLRGWSEERLNQMMENARKGA